MHACDTFRNLFIDSVTLGNCETLISSYDFYENLIENGCGAHNNTNVTYYYYQSTNTTKGGGNIKGEAFVVSRQGHVHLTLY